MKTMLIFPAAVIAQTISSLSQAHHSFAAYAIEPIDVQGEVVSFERTGAHTVTTLEARRGDDRIQRWLVLGPPMDRLGQRAASLYFPEVGDVIGFCASPFKVARIQDTNEAVTETVRGYTMLKPDGEQQVWDTLGNLCR